LSDYVVAKTIGDTITYSPASINLNAISTYGTIINNTPSGLVYKYKIDNNWSNNITSPVAIDNLTINNNRIEFGLFKNSDLNNPVDT